MARAWIVLPLMFSLGSVPARSQSLAELAQKEKERRAAKAKEAKPSDASPKVITQEDLDRVKEGRPAEEKSAASAPSLPEKAAASGQGSRSPMGIPDTSEERALEEKAWRARAAASRAAVRGAEQAVALAQSDRNALGTGPLVGGPGLLRGGPRVVGGENPAEWTQKANAADARLAAAKAALEAAKKNLENFEEEARRAGIPPGWLR